MNACEWWATTNEEVYRGGPYESKDEAVRLYPVDQELGEGDAFWVGRAAPYVASSPVDAGDVVEGLSVQAYDSVGEVSEGWLAHVPEELEKELTDGLSKLIEGWLKNHELEPTFFSIVDSSEHEAPAAARSAGPCT